MQLTLKQYLQQYHVSKSTKKINKQSEQQIKGQPDYQHIFMHKINHLKRIIKKYIHKIQILRVVQKQLQQLQVIFNHNKNNIRDVSKFDRKQQNMCISKHSLHERKKQPTRMPILSIHDQIEDQLRTTCLGSNLDNNIGQLQFQQKNCNKQKLLKLPTYNKYNSMNLNKQKIQRQNNKIVNIHYQISHSQKIIPTKLPNTAPNSQTIIITPPSQNKSINNFLPPRLSKICSQQDDDLRNTFKSSMNNGSHCDIRMTIK